MNNNNNTKDNLYGVVIYDKAIARVLLVYVINAEQQRAFASSRQADRLES